MLLAKKFFKEPLKVGYKVINRFKDITTIKITLVTLMVVASYYFFNHVKDSTLTVISLTNAVFGIRPKTIDAWIFLRYRLLGTVIGCTFGVIYLAVATHLPKNSPYIIFLIPLFTYVTVFLSGGSQSPTTVKGAVMTLITMTLLCAPSGSNQYAFYRIIATFYGLLISILVNWVIAPTKEHPLKDFEKSLDDDTYSK